jgi:hypothetical protein
VERARPLRFLHRPELDQPFIREFVDYLRQRWAKCRDIKKGRISEEIRPFKIWLPFVDAFRTLLLRPTPEIGVLFSNIRNSGWVVQNVQEGQAKEGLESVNSY